MDFNFLSCGNHRCRFCVDDSCQSKTEYEKCEFSWKSINERAEEREKNRRETDCCGDCIYFGGEVESYMQFCDIKQREVKENGYCYAYKRKEL